MDQSRTVSMRERYLHSLSALLFLVGYGLINYYYIGITIGHAREGAWTSVRNQVIVSGASAILLFILLFAGRGIVRYLLIASFAASAYMNIAYIQIAKERVDFDTAVWLMEEVGQTTTVLASYWRESLLAAAIVGVGLAGLLVGVKLHESRRWRVDRILPGMLLLGLGLPLSIGWNYALFAVYSTRHPNESSMLTYSIASRFFPPPRRLAVPNDFQPSTPSFEKVVLIVDESVRYDYFRAILRVEFGAHGFLDLGEAVSFAPCSAASNALLRWGMSTRSSSIPSYDPRENPDIWRFARRAGFETYLIDGQSNGRPQNFINAEEWEDIDHRQFGFSDDAQIARAIRAQLQTPGYKFAYVVKRGAHFAYEGYYPRTFDPYIHSRSVSYAAAIRYTTSGFVDAVLEGIDRSRVLILYTSDHGQRLDGSGTSHCNYSPNAGEYSVPIAVYAGKPKWVERLKGVTLDPVGLLSHAQIFPTLLIAMGYAEPKVVQEYGVPLFNRIRSALILGHPYKPFPSLRTREMALRAVSSTAQIGPSDGPNDPPMGTR